MREAGVDVRTIARTLKASKATTPQCPLFVNGPFALPQADMSAIHAVMVRERSQDVRS